MCGGGGGSGGGGSNRNRNVVSITERSFQSPGTSGPEISRGEETFKRSVSLGSQRFARGAAQLAGLVSGIPGMGTFLASRVGSTVETDASGKRLVGFGTSEGGGGENQPTALAGGGRPLLPGQLAAKETELKRKKVSARVTGRKSTILAGRKIAEEQLKTKLGQ